MAELNNWNPYSVVNGTDADDNIYNSTGSDNSTVNAADGNDSIRNWGSSAVLNAGNGNDYVYNDSAASDVTILGGADNDSISNWGSYALINGDNGDDNIYNSSGADRVTVEAGAGNDSVRNWGTNSLLDGGDGDDNFYIDQNASGTTVKPGAGSDTVRQWNDALTVHTGAGTTVVQYYVDNTIDVVLDGGGGTLTFEPHNSSTATVAYRFNGVDDTISNYDGGNVIDFGRALVDGVSTDGDDLIFRVGSARITVKNMRGRAVTYSDVLGTSTDIYAPNNHTPLDTIKRFVSSLDDTSKTNLKDALKAAVRACSGFYDMQDAIDCFIADCRSINDPDRFLVEKCGIILDNSDTGAITGWDAGGRNVKTVESIIRAEGEADYPSSTFTKQRFTFTVPSRHDLNEQERLVVQAFYSWWADSIMDLIEDSYELKFSSSSLNFHSVPISFFYDSDRAAAYGGHKIEINMSDVSFEESDRTGGGLDRVLAHELTHTIQYAAINSELAAQLPAFLLEGMAELTAGRDNYTIRELADKPETLGYYLTLDYTPQYSQDLYSASYMFMRYLAKHGSDESGATDANLFDDGSNGQPDEKIYHIDRWLKYGNQLTYDRDVVEYVGLDDARLSVDSDDHVDVWLNGVDGKSYDGVRVLDARSARSSAILAGNDLNNEIYGGSGSSSLWGGAGSEDDTLIGGGGSTAYFYLVGNGRDVIDNALDDDVINLLGVRLEDINFDDVSMSFDEVKVGFNDGGSIKVNGSADVVFELGGVGFKANRATGGWRFK